MHAWEWFLVFKQQQQKNINYPKNMWLYELKKIVLVKLLTHRKLFRLRHSELIEKNL